MKIFTFLFLFGICSQQIFLHIHNLYYCFSLIIPLLIWYLSPTPYFYIGKFTFPILLGFGWALCQSYWVYSLQLRYDNSANLKIIGTVYSIPEQHNHALMFNVAVTQINQRSYSFYHPLRMRLIWFGHQSERVHVGDKWQLYVKVNEIRAYKHNQDFNYQQWLFENHINELATVQNNGVNLLLRVNRWRHPLDRFRQRLNEQLQKYLCGLPVSGMISALCVGMRDQITKQQWSVLRNTGTNHLMAIAGLHISCVASMVYLLSNIVMRRMSKLFIVLPLQQITVLISLLVAIIYSALAGFSLPTQRAIIMLSVFLINNLLRRNISAWNAWCVALLFISITDPLSILSSSFWLSFGTVALIIYGNSARLKVKGIWWHWGRTQWVIGLGIMPLSILFFKQVTLLSFIANSIAIPCVGFIILPLCVFGVLFNLLIPQLGKLCLWSAEKLLEYLWIILVKLSSIPHFLWHINHNNLIEILCLFIAVIILLAPKGWPGRWLGILWALPVIMKNIHPI